MTESVEDMLRSYATQPQLDALNRYFELLTEWNKHINLTAIVQRQEVYVKHFWDSLALLNLDVLQKRDKPVASMIDVGTGAGLPGIPIAICRPEVRVTLCDSLNKRTKFLEVVKEELNLDNVSIFHARSEEFARLQQHRNQYDIVTARAVAKLNVLSELLVPFTRPGGYVIAYKGPDAAAEIEEAANALRQLNASVVSAQEIELPEGMGRRTMIVLKVHKPTANKYPRRAGVPQKQPL